MDQDKQASEEEIRSTAQATDDELSDQDLEDVAGGGGGKGGGGGNSFEPGPLPPTGV